jgi:hypothetical protein
MQAREQEFLWHGRLPVGHLTVIAGSPRMGKSTLGYRIAATTGVRTLFVTTEEVDESVWLPRLLASGVDPEHAWHHPEIRFTKNLSDLSALGALIDLYEVRLIVVDPIQNHLGVSVSHDQAVRDLMEPYMALIQLHRVALLLEAHVLRDVKAGSDPLLAVPAGLRGWAKAVYLFGRDPTLGADPELRVLATAKFNFGKEPESRRFEFATSDVEVARVSGRGRMTREYGMWIDRGEVAISAKALLVTFSPETKDRKSERAAWELIEFLRKGTDGRTQSVSAIRQMVNRLDPPVSWRTVERVAKELGIEVTDDPRDARRKLWSLPDSILATYEEADEGDEIVIEEVEIDEVPDTVPEEWSEGDGGEDDGS